MKLSGVQYYWIVAIGMLAGLALSIPLTMYAREINSSPPLILLLVAALILPTICYYTVMLELWSRFRFKAVAAVGGVLLLSAFVHPAFVVLVILGPIIYWFSRINGVSNGG